MLSEKVALITGAAQGIGLCTARLLLRNGAKVAAVDISKSLASACEKLGTEFGSDRILCLPCDVTDKASLASAFEKAKEKFGQLDIVINNAGISDEHRPQELLQVNLYAVIIGTYLAVEHMSTNTDSGQGGVVINVSSMAGLYPVSYAPVYCASKFGVVAFTRSLEHLKDYDNVRVTCICPAYTNTQMVHDNKDILKNFIDFDNLIGPELVAQGVLKLITDESAAGSVLRVTPRRGLSYHIFSSEKPTIPHSKL